MNNLPIQHEFKSLRRRGSVYLLVLGAGMILTVVGIAMTTVSQIGLSKSDGEDASLEAGVLAESAVEMGLARIASDSSWRTTYTNNVESASLTLGRGKISFKIVDKNDSSLSNNTTDPYRVYGIGRTRASTRMYSVLCNQKPLGTLAYAMYTDPKIDFGNTSFKVLGSSTIGSNVSIAGTSGQLNGTNLEANSSISISGITGTGAYRQYQSLKEMPNSSSVFNYYTTNGTTISGLPVVNVVLGLLSTSYIDIKRNLICPTNNPYGGGTDAQGIYIINCSGQKVSISSCRIIGTMVLTNCGGLTIGSDVVMEPAIKGYPALMVQGDVLWSTDDTTLNETDSAGNVNFNPSGAPYPYYFGGIGGSSNTIITDTYPSRINGLVYITGKLTTTGSPSLKGVILVGGTWSMQGSLSLEYDSTYFSYPAPGFYSTKMGPIAGSWKWEPAP